MNAYSKVTSLWRRRFVRFAGIGVINTAVDFLLLNILVFLFHLNSIPANIISASIAMVISYILNHYFVFRSEKKHSGFSVATFILITASGLFIAQNLILHFFTESLTWPADTLYSAAKALHLTFIEKEFVVLNFAKAVATAFTMLWNYCWYKNTVFKNRSTKDQDVA